MTQGRWWAAQRWSAVRAAHRLLALLPASERACVFGWPDYEENSLVAAVSLAEEGDLEVTLLVDNPERAGRYLTLVNPTGAPVELVRKSSLRGLVRAGRARALLFTHGLYGSADLTASKLVVNLWHGFGPKATANKTFARRISFELMTCNSPVWARAAARVLGAPEARIVRTGNPRQASLRTTPRTGALEKLGLAGVRYVLWMPTQRSSSGSSGPAWRDSVDLSGRRFHGEELDPVSQIARVAQEAGVELVVKPHPLDADDYVRSGLRVVTGEEILDAGMTVYQFIGASAAMISDYSSVWVEYLDLDRPLLLYCPDLGEYLEGRGLNEPYMTDIAKDLIVEMSDEAVPFFRAVEAGADWRPEARAALREALDLPAPHSELGSVGALVREELMARRAGERQVPSAAADRGVG
jgi:CDP-glycerol glycerophosphotransferase